MPNDDSRDRPGAGLDGESIAAPDLSPGAVLELARLEGHALIDAEVAARIAVGASNAIRAVTASVRESLFDVDPAGYLAELERLADQPARGAR